MSAQRKRLLSVALGAALLVTMLLLSSLNTTPTKPPLKNIVLKDVHMYVPPPPPPKTPPAPKRSNSAISGGSMQIDQNPQTVELGRMKLDTRFANAQGVPVTNGLGGVGFSGSGGTGTGIGGTVEILTLDQLDSTPMPVSSPPLPISEYLAQKNIKQLRVMFHIVIDEDGKTYPVRVVDSPAPELNALFMDYAKHVTFTPPRRKGQTVKAQYLWPVVFSRK